MLVCARLIGPDIFASDGQEMETRTGDFAARSLRMINSTIWMHGDSVRICSSPRGNDGVQATDKGISLFESCFDSLRR